jgi:two-component sensor histidine kinase
MRCLILLPIAFLASTFMSPASAFSDPPERLLAQADTLLKHSQAQAALPVCRAAYEGFEQQNNRPGMAQAMLTTGHAHIALMQTDEAISAYRSAMDLTRGEHFNETYYLALDAAAVILFMRGDVETVVPMLREKIALSSQKQNDPKYREGLATNQAELGYAFIQLGKLDSAKMLIETALATKKSIGNQAGVNRCLNFLGFFHVRVGNLDKALECYLEALEGAKSIRDTANISVCLGNVSGIFADMKNWERAEEYALEAYRLAEKKGYKNRKADASVRLAEIRLQNGDLAGALARYDEATGLYRNNKSHVRLIGALLAAAEIQIRLGKLGAAEIGIKEALALAEQSHDRARVAQAQSSYGEYWLRKNVPSQAIIWLEKAATTATSASAKKELEKIWRLLSEACEKTGDPVRALAFHRRYTALKDSLFGLEKQQAVNELETRYQAAGKEKQIALLNTQNELGSLRLEQSQRRQWLLLSGLAALALLAGLAFFLMRAKQTANRQLAEKNAAISQALSEKELLLKEIHHRVKNNLQVISGLLKLQSRHLSDPSALDALREGRNRVQSMALIHQNLYQEENLTGIEAGTYIGKLADALFLSYNIAPGAVELDTQIEPLRLDVDTAIPLGLILNELISNSLKHAFPEGKQGRINVSLQKQGDALQLKVADNGIGMPAQVRGKGAGKSNFGFQLIELLAEKLKAQVSVSGENGASVELNIQNFRLA